MRSVRRAAIVVAGGTGDRFGREGGKQLVTVAGRPALSWSLAALEECAFIDLIVVVCAPGRLDEYGEVAVEPLALHTPVIFAEGGLTRRLSVAAGLAVLPDTVETVVVHDGARPLAPAELFSRAVTALEESVFEGVVVGHPSVDTLKVVEGGTVVETPDRSRFWMIQTPQVFRAAALIEAHRLAGDDSFEGTDDASLIERADGAIGVLEGPRDNIKITLEEDLVFAEAVLVQRTKGSGPCSE